METNSALAKLDTATRMLAEISSVDEAINLIDLAEAARVYARQVHLGLEAQNHAAEIKVRAQRRAGEILEQMDKAKGAAEPGWKTPLPEERASDKAPTYDDLDISYKQAHQWQTIAKLPEQQFEQVLADAKENEREITTAAVYRAAKQEINQQERQTVASGSIYIPEGRYQTIVIDPPWPMEKILREVAPNQVGFEYPTMSLDEIGAFDIPAADDCHLFLWTTQKFLPSAFDILTNWNFKYIFTMVWHKPGGFQPFNLPQYNCEFILYGRRGSPIFLDLKDFMTCFNAPRREHSRKPDEFYSVVERVCPGPRIDIFSREKRNGFDQYGNEPTKFTDSAAV